MQGKSDYGEKCQEQGFHGVLLFTARPFAIRVVGVYRRMASGPIMRRPCGLQTLSAPLHSLSHKRTVPDDETRPWRLLSITYEWKTACSYLYAHEQPTARSSLRLSD